jgi:stage III sporulation protein AE
MLGFLLVSALGQVHTEGVTRTLRSLYITVLGIFSLLISASLALGTSLGSARDSLTLRSLRFAVGQMLPVVGGTVSGSLGAAMASLSLIRGTAGIGMAVAVLLPLLPIVAELFLVRASLSLLASFGEMLGVATPARLFRSYRALLDLVLAAVAMAGLLFIFLGATLSRCAPAVGV